MATDVHDHPATDQSVTSLVGGIVGDAQELLKQQAALIRAELLSDFRKTREAGLLLVLGLAVCLVASIVLCLTFVYLLDWATELPLWACYAIVGGIVAAIGTVLVLVGKQKFESFNPLPDESVEALKENLQWTTNRR